MQEHQAARGIPPNTNKTQNSHMASSRKTMTARDLEREGGVVEGRDGKQTTRERDDLDEAEIGARGRLNSNERLDTEKTKE